jgi:hypothetical protein
MVPFTGLALAPVRKRRVDQVTIVDDTLIPTRDHRLAAPSKNYRYSTDLQVAIDTDTRLAVATGDPNQATATTAPSTATPASIKQLAGRPVMADGGYQGNPGMVMPYRKPRDGSARPDWQDSSTPPIARSAPASSMP